MFLEISVKALSKAELEEVMRCIGRMKKIYAANRHLSMEDISEQRSLESDHGVGQGRRGGRYQKNQLESVYLAQSLHRQLYRTGIADSSVDCLPSEIQRTMDAAFTELNIIRKATDLPPSVCMPSRLGC